MDVCSDTPANEKGVASTSEGKLCTFSYFNLQSLADSNILEIQTQSTDHLEYVIPDILALDSSNNGDSSNFDDELLQEDPDGLPSGESEADVSISGIVQTYFLELKVCLSREIAFHKMPLCYQWHHFWIYPVEPSSLRHWKQMHFCVA